MRQCGVAARWVTAIRTSRLWTGPPADPPLVPTFDYILTPPPYIEEADLDRPTTVQLTTGLNHRGGLNDHLVGWHQAEYSSCAAATWSRYYFPTPAWWSGVEVPYQLLQ